LFKRIVHNSSKELDDLILSAIT